MRLLIDTLIAVMLAGMFGVIVHNQRVDHAKLEGVAAVQQSIRAIQSQSLYRAAMKEAAAMPNGYARVIDAAWFSEPPRNILVDKAGGAFQWLDYAPEGGHTLFDPPCIVAGGKYGAFWYNPHRGIVRARVPNQFTQQATVELYNLVNGTSLSSDDCRWDYSQYATVPLAPPAQATAEVSTDPLLRDFAAKKR